MPRAVRYFGLALAVGGCVAPPPDGPPRREAIVGGAPETGEPAVVLVMPFAGIERCTGTLISERVVLTAKHCVQAPGAEAPFSAASITIGVGDRFGATTDYRAERVATTPGRYTASPTMGLGGALVGQDVAVVTLREAPPGITPIPVRRTSPTDLIGREVTAVGFGLIPGGSSGVKYSTTTSPTMVIGNVIYGAMAICSGDSGGPLIEEADADSPRRIVGVASFGEADACPSRQDGWNRVDAYLGMIDAAILATGGCPEMREETCNSVDDDCDAAIDEGCAALGAPCSEDADCAFAQLPDWFEPREDAATCADTPAGRICTRACDPMRPARSCATVVAPFVGVEMPTSGIYCRRTEACAGLCVPGVAGSLPVGDPCAADTDCASLACLDPGTGTPECVVPCRGDAGLCFEGDVCAAGAGSCGGCVGADRLVAARGIGEPCTEDGECQGGRCLDEARIRYCTRSCTDDAACGDGFHCRSPEMICVRGPRSVTGGGCIEDGDCLVGDTCADDPLGWCTHGCTVDSACPDGFRCGELGDARVCVPSTGRLGTPCDADADCLSGTCDGRCTQACGAGAPCPTGLRCVGDEAGTGASCRPPPRPSSDGGCSATGPAPAGWAWLAALVLALGVMRRRHTVVIASWLLIACGGGVETRRSGSREGAQCAGLPVTCAQLVQRHVHDAENAPQIALDLEPECEMGVAGACLALGFFLLDGEGVEHDPQRAARLLEQGCDRGDVPACVRLGTYWAAGPPNPEDDRRAATVLTRACDRGDADACDGLGRLTESGRGVERDPARALELYWRACRGRNLHACRKVDDHYILAGDHQARLRLHSQMCGAGHLPGCTQLARMYERGEGAERDPERALTLYRQACDGDEPEACTRLGEAHVEGELGLAQDSQEAIVYHRRQCDRQHWRACVHLGVLYEDGAFGEPDLTSAIALYRRACDHLDGHGCWHLGVAYMLGAGVEADPARGVQHLRAACESGVEPSCGALADAYDQGHGVARNPEQAAQLHFRACDAGEAPSCARLAEMLERGEGVPADRPRAQALRDRACQQQAFPDLCPRARWSTRVFNGTATRVPLGMNVERGTSCEVRVDSRLEPHWCHLRVRCGETDLVETWARCTLGEGRPPALDVHGDQVDLDTAARRANARGIQITLGD